MLAEIWRKLGGLFAAHPEPLTKVTPLQVAAKLVAEGVRLRASNAGEPLNPFSSVVDLLKTLGLPSDLEARKRLADDLGFVGYTGTDADNIELHEAIMDELGDQRNFRKLME